MDYLFFMQEAIEEAKKAKLLNEVPIGCVIVYNQEIIARGHNKRNSGKNSLYHAEILAINEACKHMCDWRLEDCYMFVTVEPCPMCAGAILQARMKKVIFGTRNKKAGCCGSILNIVQQEGFNHKVEIEEGILETQCGQLMSDFFHDLRKKSSKEL